MSLDVSPALLAQAEHGRVNQADFLDTVRASLPYAYQVVAGLSTELSATEDEFTTDNTTPTDEERAQLLRALASNAIRGSLEDHFGVKLAFVNCHRVGAFRPGTEDGDAYREFTSLHNQIRNQSPELRSC
ncbi:SCO5389 family protein [Kitasatospora sp. NPDC059811]|uniref:SCO5389 family protein n=1 Tax=Streptomycetaceae TaxID=2062 RepID=UPI0007AFD9FB|nr:SCO5389 family protein [Streptomyces sp. MJM8645]WSK02622.1 SCO5389 family protein [Kitasatospora sp. NBC_01300]